MVNVSGIIFGICLFVLGGLLLSVGGGFSSIGTNETGPAGQVSVGTGSAFGWGGVLSIIIGFIVLVGSLFGEGGNINWLSRYR